LLIDIAVPRDIEPEVNFMENVFLYNIDDLQAIADDYLKQRQAEVARCEKLIRDKVEGLLGPSREGQTGGTKYALTLPLSDAPTLSRSHAPTL
jgi:glutamyl-tRNA reductase